MTCSRLGSAVSFTNSRPTCLSSLLPDRIASCSLSPSFLRTHPTGAVLQILETAEFGGIGRGDSIISAAYGRLP